MTKCICGNFVCYILHIFSISINLQHHQSDEGEIVRVGGIECSNNHNEFPPQDVIDSLVTEEDMAYPKNWPVLEGWMKEIKKKKEEDAITSAKKKILQHVND